MSIEIANETAAGSLYLVATPIGNLLDMSRRAIDVLKQVDLIAAEDTRHSLRLLNHFGIDTEMLAYHEHNEQRQADNIVELLLQGRSIALISDAGTPLVSDPGYRLLERVHRHAIRVVPVPGACAAIAALSVAGLATNRFAFEGFPPAKQGARLKYFESLKNEARTLIFYVSCHRVLDTLYDMRDVFGGERIATYGRELTKAYETVRRSTLAALCDWVETDDDQRKGEIVVVVAGDEARAVEHPLANNILKVLVDELPVKQAAKIAAQITGMHKNELYKMALALKGEHD